MITEFFFSLLFGLLNLILGFMPSFDFIANIGAISGFIDVLNAISSFFPVSTAIQVFFVLIAFHNFKFIVSIVNFVIRKIPGVN